MAPLPAGDAHKIIAPGDEPEDHRVQGTRYRRNVNERIWTALAGTMFASVWPAHNRLNLTQTAQFRARPTTLATLRPLPQTLLTLSSTPAAALDRGDRHVSWVATCTCDTPSHSSRPMATSAPHRATPAPVAETAYSSCKRPGSCSS